MSKRVLIAVLLFGLVVSAHANDRENEASELRQRACQLTDIWTAPVKLTGEIRFVDAHSGSRVLTVELFWAGTDQWRVQWNDASYTRTEAVSAGKSWHKTNADVQPLPVFIFRDALRRIHDY